MLLFAGPAAAFPGFRRRMASLVLALLLLVVPFGLSGCRGAAQPPRRVLIQALELQIRLTQGAIAQALALESTGLPEVNRVRVEQQSTVLIGDARGLRLAGRFDWRLPGDPIRVDSGFELFLQPGERGQSWRLARPVAGSDGSDQSWIIDPLPLSGERA
ncbi:MAG: hypothetical protein VKK98_02845 [Cyanobacteriota bacterium]|nr:hypothetical protein [Cyanobacteriota bacterium]